MGTVRRRAIVSGRVQGVWYRESCRREAQRLGATGWARNLADGTVEVVAEGEETAVQRLLDWCRTGPPRAEVTAVAITEEAPEGTGSFRVG